MLATSSLAKRILRENVTFKVRKTKTMLRNFNNDERGMNTVEAIILLFVAAIVLVVFFTVIWPLIGEKVWEALQNLFGQEGDFPKT